MGFRHECRHGVRTLRKAREQVKNMVIDEVSPRRIRNYLHRWVTWWVNATRTWNYNELIQWFCTACFDITPATYAAGLILRDLRKSHNANVYGWPSVDFAVMLTAA